MTACLLSKANILNYNNYYVCDQIPLIYNTTWYQCHFSEYLDWIFYPFSRWLNLKTFLSNGSYNISLNSELTLTFCCKMIEIHNWNCHNVHVTWIFYSLTLSAWLYIITEKSWECVTLRWWDRATWKCPCYSLPGYWCCWPNSFGL